MSLELVPAFLPLSSQHFRKRRIYLKYLFQFEITSLPTSSCEEIMHQFFRFFLITLLSLASAYAAGHDSDGTHYGDAGNAAYELNRHGADGAIFLDPYFLADLQDLEEKWVLDSGCGSGSWSIYCAQHGAQVFGIDIQEGMVERARNAVRLAGVEERAVFTVGSVGDLPYGDNLFDAAISINVGCNLPTSIFSACFQEIFRCLKPGGKVTVTAPSSFGIVFTINVGEEAAHDYIDQVLEQINIDPNPTSIVEGLGELTEVLRGTFVMRGGELKLITDESDLIAGENIWRKIPGLTVPNNYHSEEEYLEAFALAGFSVDSVDRPTGSHPNLGAQYQESHAFAVFHLTKP